MNAPCSYIPLNVCDVYTPVIRWACLFSIISCYD
nr:MAG TPA: hypothetical protein [Caudoviricetes sp.]